MPTLDVYVHATKRDAADQLIAHAGFVRDDVSRRGRLHPGAYALKTGKQTFGQMVEGLNGMDPYTVLAVSLPALEAALEPPQKRIAYGFLTDLRLACEHCQRVRVMNRAAKEQQEESDGGTTIADLYQNDFRIVIKRDGVLIG